MAETSWQKVIFETYRNHSIAIKQIPTNEDCYGNHQWAWQSFGECIADDYQCAGLVTGLLVTIVFVFARHFTMLHIRRSLKDRWPKIVLLALLIDVLSLLGAILAMQLFQVIFFDLVVTVADSIMAVLTLVIAFQNTVHRRAGYMEIGTLRRGSIGKESSLCLRPFSSWCSCLAVCIFATPILMTSAVHLKLHHRPLEIPLFQETTSNGHYTHALVNSCGYVMGSLACFGHWALLIYIFSSMRNKEQNKTVKFVLPYEKQDEPLEHSLSIRNKEENTSGSSGSRSTTIGGAVIMACDFLYVFGVMLHSRGWMVSMVTLPWIMQSCHNDLTRPQDDDIQSLMESRSESDSDASDSSNVLWDRTWKLPGIKDTFVYYEKTKARGHQFDEVRRKLVSGDVTTSIDSDWSTTSVEQELEWEDETVSYMASHQPFIQAGVGRNKKVPHNLTPLTLTLTATESRVERVRSWVSNSTPEEEKAPCLAAALDLDINSNFFCDPFCDEDVKKPCHPPKRKYSL